ncbi:MAG TPA: aminotransferase class I/II-fold pyridoxal phosphate-dependent enzyme [Candidatus Paceibacterota bacterium]|nr:aminotransferase class I/II-fold pyridoxal phosphate-dependent enzyme [Candidatus Paceibacterota bacterium]
MDAIADLSLRERFERLRAMKLDLDMTRGKPCAEQLDLSLPLLTSRRTRSIQDGADCRNYGYLEGLPEARKLFGEYLGMPAELTYVLGNSSLAVMHDLVVQMLMRQLPDEERKWDPHHEIRYRPVMLCPVPGYDRHFSICERYGIEMVSIPLTDQGPDMDAVESVLGGPKGHRVFGMWCTPKYSNPSGITYSRDVCQQLASMKTAPGFRIFWDLAYNVHDLEEPGDELANFFELCRAVGNEDRPFIIGSTSKITFAGAGLAMLAASPRNLAWFRESLFVRTIGADKLNQLRHVEFLYSMKGIRDHMRKQAAIIKPKFDAMCEVFDRELGGRDIASWQKPRGGYFVALKVKKGCAKKTVSLAGELGVKMTPAGNTHPYGKDPNDEWFRCSPTFPPLEEVRLGAEVPAVCLRIAAEL